MTNTTSNQGINTDYGSTFDLVRITLSLLLLATTPLYAIALFSANYFGTVEGFVMASMFTVNLIAVLLMSKKTTGQYFRFITALFS
jgi:hypothetical protein